MLPLNIRVEKLLKLLNDFSCSRLRGYRQIPAQSGAPDAAVVHTPAAHFAAVNNAANGAMVAAALVNRHLLNTPSPPRLLVWWRHNSTRERQRRRRANESWCPATPPPPYFWSLSPKLPLFTSPFLQRCFLSSRS